jgi:Armadillo/beta-catenin-like repeat
MLWLTGLPASRKAGAEALTTMAASRVLPVSCADSRAQGSGSAVNLKVEVIRAGAIPALTSMLRVPDETCIQAAANALYVITQQEEGRTVMPDSGGRRRAAGCDRPCQAEAAAGGCPDAQGLRARVGSHDRVSVLQGWRRAMAGLHVAAQHATTHLCKRCVAP